MQTFIIALHGVGSRGADLAGLGELLTRALPQARFVAPDGPARCGAGYEWFNLAGITPQNRPERVVAARAALDDCIADLCTQADVQPGRDRLVVTGFSQGAIMALDLLARDPFPLSAVVAFSGRLASPAPLQPAHHSPLLLVHGQADPVIPWQESQAAARQFEMAGAQVSTWFEPGLGHGLSLTGAQQAADFIGRQLN